MMQGAVSSLDVVFLGSKNMNCQTNWNLYQRFQTSIMLLLSRHAQWSISINRLGEGIGTEGTEAATGNYHKTSFHGLCCPGDGESADW